MKFTLIDPRSSENKLEVDITKEVHNKIGEYEDGKSFEFKAKIINGIVDNEDFNKVWVTNNYNKVNGIPDLVIEKINEIHPDHKKLLNIGDEITIEATTIVQSTTTGFQ